MFFDMSVELKQYISTYVYKNFSSISMNFCHQIWIFCLSETYSNSEIPYDNEILKSLGYILIREDHPSNSEHRRICVYNKSLLPFNVISVKYRQECISFEFSIGGKYCIFSCLYSSPIQMQDELESFVKNFELTLDKIHESNPVMIAVLGHFNAKSNNWCKADITFLLKAL